MKSDKEILYTLRRFKEAKIELKKYLSWIEQIKVSYEILYYLVRNGIGSLIRKINQLL